MLEEWSWRAATFPEAVDNFRFIRLFLRRLSVLIATFRRFMGITVI